MTSSKIQQPLWPVSKVIPLLARAGFLLLRAAAPVSCLGYRFLPRPTHLQLVDWPGHLHAGDGREPLRSASPGRLGVAVLVDALRRHPVHPAVLFQPV